MKGRIKILAPLAVLICGAVVLAILAWPKGAPAEPGPPTPFEQEDPPAPQTGLFPTDKITVPLKDLPPLYPPFAPNAVRPPQKSVEEMTPEELEMHNKIEALKDRPNPFKSKKPLRKVTDDDEEDGGGVWPE